MNLVVHTSHGELNGKIVVNDEGATFSGADLNRLVGPRTEYLLHHFGPPRTVWCDEPHKFYATTDEVAQAWCAAKFNLNQFHQLTRVEKTYTGVAL